MSPAIQLLSPAIWRDCETPMRSWLSSPSTCSRRLRRSKQSRCSISHRSKRREFEQKVAKATKGIRVRLGGGWRHTAKSGRQKPLVPRVPNTTRSPLLPLRPSVQNSLLYSPLAAVAVLRVSDLHLLLFAEP